MDGSDSADRVDRAALSRQWRQEGRYEEIAEFRQQVKEATKKAWRSAGRQWDRDELNEVAWQEAARAFPPPEKPAESKKAQSAPIVGFGQEVCSNSADSGQVQGLGDIPDEWPDLPDNASLPAEIGWVQSQRLRVVEELPSGAIRVHLDRARTPAPSWSALGWLETSIRSYAKFVDVAARAMAHTQDEADHIRREKLALDEIRGLLAEMLEE